MDKTLLITASARYEGSYTRRMAGLLEGQLRAIRPQTEIVHRDLVASPPPYISDEMIQGFFGRVKGDERRVEAALAVSNEWVAELLNAETLVIAAPMYNFGVPASVKAWIDLVLRPGLAFKKVADGNIQGLCKGKRLLVLCAMSGCFAEHPVNCVEPYLRVVANFIGVDDIAFIYVEGTAQRNFRADDALRQCEQEIASWLAEEVC